MRHLFYSFSTFIFFQLPLLAQGVDEEPPARDSGIWQTAIMIGIFLVFFYFILFRPEQRRRQEAEAQRARIKKGDRVTAMGIIGTVVKIQENTIVMKMYDGSKIEVLKGAITDVVPGSEEDAKRVEKEDI